MKRLLQLSRVLTVIACVLSAVRPFHATASDLVSTNTATSAARPPCCRELEPGAPLTDRSVYHLESRWTSDVGREVPLAVFAGRPQVVALFFTHCEYACPIIVSDLRRIEAALPEAVRSRVDFLLVSIDSERDTPTVLRAYRDSRKLPMERWTLLHGDAEDVRELAAVLGVNYRKDARGQYLHSNIITLLDARGEVMRQLTGLNQDVGTFAEAVAAATAATTGN